MEAGGAMSSQGLGEVPGEGHLLFVRLAEMSENMQTMAIILKNIKINKADTNRQRRYRMQHCNHLTV